MWVNTNIAADGKPDNSKWRLCLDFIDGIDVQVISPQSYQAPDECDIEIRRSDTNSHDIYKGGSHWRRLSAADIAAFNSGGNTPPPDPDPDPNHPGNVDQFGIKMIYPTKDNGQTWFQNNNPEADGRLISIEETITRTGDYFVAIPQTGGVTLPVTTTFGTFGRPACEDVDWSNFENQGNVFTSDDWRNVEITALVFPQELNTNNNEPADFDWAFEARVITGELVVPAGCCSIFRYAAVLLMTNTGSNIGKVRFSKVPQSKVTPQGS